MELMPKKQTFFIVFFFLQKSIYHQQRDTRKLPLERESSSPTIAILMFVALEFYACDFLALGLAEHFSHGYSVCLDRMVFLTLEASNACLAAHRLPTL